MGEGKQVILTMNINIFMQNYLIINPEFLTNMHGTLSSIIIYLKEQGFDIEDKEEKEKNDLLMATISEIETKINIMKYSPIAYIKDTELAKTLNKGNIRKIPDMHLSEIEWITYRETHYRTKLKRKFPTRKGWRNVDGLIFSDVLKISAQIKQDLYNCFMQLIEQLDIENLDISIPQLQPEKSEGTTWQK